MLRLSVIFSTFNEMKLNIFTKEIDRLTKISDLEIICVDGGSTDGTCHFLKESPALLISSQSSSRGERYNAGIEAAAGKIVLLHHPRSEVDIQGINYLLDHYREITWGAFTHKFDLNHPILNWTSWYSNHIRGDLNGIYYLDHSIFSKREFLKKCGMFPEKDIFEDTELCLRLKKMGRGERLPFYSTTSAVRFKKNGVLTQSIFNQLLKLGYKLGISHSLMNKIYERNLKLNASYGENNEKKDS